MAYVKNPAIDKLSTADQLKFYGANQADAGNEILRAKQVYESKKAAGDMAGANAAHSWADQLRSASGIQDSNPVYGNNNGVDPVTQAKMTDSILNNQTAQQAPRAAAGGGAGGTYNSNDYMNRSQQLIDSIYNNNYNSQLQKLREARDTQLQGLNGQETQAHQSAYDQRNAADTTNLQNAQRLREMMAQNGLLSSGDNIQANVDLGTARQAALGGINRDEGNAVQNIAQQRALIMNNAANNDLALMQQLQAARAGQLLSANDTDAARQLQIAQLMGSLNGAPTLAAQQFGEQQQQDNIGNAMNLSQLTGQLYQPKSSGEALFNQTPLGSTLAGRQANLNAALQVGAQRGQVLDPKQDWGLLFSEQGTPNYQAQQDAIQNQFKEQQSQQQAQQFAASLGLDYAKMSQQQQGMLLDAAYKSGILGLDQAKFNYETDPNNTDNQYKAALTAKVNQELASLNLPKSQKAEDFIPQLNQSTFMTKDPVTGRAEVYDDRGMSQMILSLNLPDAETNKLFSYYNINPDHIRQQYSGN